MDEQDAWGLDESLRHAALGSVIQLAPYLRTADMTDIIHEAEKVYQFLKTGKVPEKAADDAELQ